MPTVLPQVLACQQRLAAAEEALRGGRLSQAEGTAALEASTAEVEGLRGQLLEQRGLVAKVSLHLLFVCI